MSLTTIGIELPAMTKPSTKDLAAQWKRSRVDAAKKLRLILEGKAKCDDHSRAALAYLVEYHDPTKINLSSTPNKPFAYRVREDITIRCDHCGFFFCNCPVNNNAIPR
jgi:hypothetical protein